MAAVRFRSEFKTSLGVQFKVEIYDQQHTGSVTDFKLGDRGFVVNWRGENNDMFSPILGSEVDFDMMIEDATHEQFITDIAASPENRFWVGIYKGTGSALYWCGIVAPDIARVEDLDYPYAFNVKASDGLGLLKNSNYADNKYTPIRGYERFTTIIERCLNFLPHIAHYYSGSTNFLNTSINWYEDSHTYAQTYDPLYHTFANNDVTYSASDQASWNNAIYTYKSAYDVLAAVMRVWGARITHVEGVFLIEQLETRVTNSFFSRKYGYPVGTASAVFLVDRASIKPTQTPARRKMLGAHYTWYPALKEVRITYPSLNRRNFWPAQNFSYAGSGPRAPETNTGYQIAAGPGAQFYFNANIIFNIPQYGWGSVISEGDNYYVVAKLTIKIQGTNTYHLVRTINTSQFGSTYGPTVWQQFPGTYDFILPAFLALDSATFSPITIQSTLNFISPPVPFDGALIVNLAIERVYGPDATNNLQFNDFDVANIFNFNYQVLNPSLTLQETTTNALTYIAENDDSGNSAIYEAEVIWGDGDQPNTLGRLRTFDGSVYTDTDKWGVKTTSGTSLIQKLLAERILRMQKTPTKRMYATVYGADFPLYKNLIDSNEDEWYFIGGQYTANLDQWQGEWFNIRINNNGTIVIQTEEAEQYPGTDNPPGPFGDNSTERFPGGNVAPATLEPLAAAVVAVSYPSGSAPGSGISINSVLGAGAFVQGQQIAIVNPSSGQFAYFEVTSDSIAGDTTIGISGSFPSRFPAGSYVINLPSNYTVSGGVGPAQGGGGGFTGILPLASGGTGASGAPQALTNLGATTVGGNIFTLPNPNNTTFLRVNSSNTVTARNVAETRTDLGATTVGTNLFTLTNPSAIRFLRINADNTVTARSAADFRGDIGAGTGNGTVTSVGLTAPNIFTVSGSPITASGNFGVSLNGQAANSFLAAPSGASGVPAFRAIVPADVPTLNQNTTGTAANVTGIVAVANGGTGASGQAQARTNLGATTVGSNIFTLPNQSEITFIRINANNTITARNPLELQLDLGSTTVGRNIYSLTSINAVSYARINANNTVTARGVADTRTDLGATTVGSNLFTLANPSAVSFPRINADNTVTTLNASGMREAIGAASSEDLLWQYDSDVDAIYYTGSGYLQQNQDQNLFFSLNNNSILEGSDSFFEATSASGNDQYTAYAPKSVNNKTWFAGRDGSDDGKYKIGLGGNVFASGAVEIDTNRTTYVKQLTGLAPAPTLTLLPAAGNTASQFLNGNSYMAVFSITTRGSGRASGAIAQITPNASQVWSQYPLAVITPCTEKAGKIDYWITMFDVGGYFELFFGSVPEDEASYGFTIMMSGY